MTDEPITPTEAETPLVNGYEYVDVQTAMNTVCARLVEQESQLYLAELDRAERAAGKIEAERLEALDEGLANRRAAIKVLRGERADPDRREQDRALRLLAGRPAGDWKAVLDALGRMPHRATAIPAIVAAVTWGWAVGWIVRYPTLCRR